jgi:isoquinoline 1-oxidoreductase beta subunit
VLWIERPHGFASAAAQVFEPSAYVSITPDNIVRLWITRSEMGQGVRTTLPMMLVEELEANWAQIRLEQAMPGGRFKDIRLRTSGSGSTVGSYRDLRMAGATAREMLIAVAAEKWKVEPAACFAQKGAVVHRASGRKLTFGALALAATKQNVPGKPALKAIKDFKLIVHG